MNYEQKYNEALERARKLKENPQSVFNEYSPKEGDTICDYIFPELCESEDELTWLTKYIKEEAYSLSMDIRDNEDRIKLKNLQRSLDWLEKQSSNVDNANKEYWRGYREGKQEFADKYAELEKQGEQKSAWSREDEKIRQTIINEFKQCSEWYCSNGLTKEDCINWLNKQEYFEWGDEDNENMNSLCVLLDQMVSINAIGNEHSIEYKNWLKSLKQRVGG